MHRFNDPQHRLQVLSQAGNFGQVKPKRKRKSGTTPEGKFKSEVVKYFNKIGALVIPYSVGYFKTMWGANIRIGKSGMSDLIVVFRGKVYFIETKATTKQEESQKNFQKELEAVGGQYILARSLEDVINNI